MRTHRINVGLDGAPPYYAIGLMSGTSHDRAGASRFLLSGAGRNCDEIAGIFDHRVAHIGMGLEESIELEMLMQVTSITYQRWLISQRARDSRMRICELTPGPQLR